MNFEPKHIAIKPRQIFVCVDDMLLALFIVLVLFLTACEGKGGERGGLSSHSDNTIRVDAPVSMSIDPLLPPGADDRPALPGESGRQRTAEGLPILDPKGPSLKQIFREDVKDPIDRIKRVENAVLEMRQDLDSVLPAINRLVSIEGDIQALTSQLQALLAEENGPLGKASSQEGDISQSYSSTQEGELPASSEQEPDGSLINSNTDQDNSKLVVSSGDVVASEPLQVENNAPGPEDADINAVLSSLKDDVIDINSIRIGNHPDKTRIVIDSPVNIKFSTDLDLQEHVLVVDLPGIQVREMNQDVTSNSLIKSISLNASEGSEIGGQAVFELKKNAHIKRSTIMIPGLDRKQFRILIDLGE